MVGFALTMRFVFGWKGIDFPRKSSDAWSSRLQRLGDRNGAPAGGSPCELYPYSVVARAPRRSILAWLSLFVRLTPAGLSPHDLIYNLALVCRTDL